MSVSEIITFVKRGAFEEVRRCFEADSTSVNSQDNDGMSVLHLAIKFDFTTIARYLIAGGANIDLQDNCGHTPLHMASIKGRLVMAQQLVQEGADMNITTNDCNISALWYAVSLEKLDIAQLLILNGASIDICSTKGTSVLHEAINKNFEDIIQLLLQTGADVDIPDCDGESPLHMVISQAAQLTDVARILVQKGASVNTKNSYGDTALHKAFDKGYSDIADLLVREGADPKFENQDKNTAFDVHPWAARPWGSGDIRPAMRIFIANHWHSTPIHEACYENDILMLRSLLDSEMASQYISCRDHCGWMAIHVAAFMNRVEIFDLLLTRGANLFAITGGLRGFTTLHLACSRGHIEIIALSIAAAQSLTVHLS